VHAWATATATKARKHKKSKGFSLEVPLGAAAASHRCNQATGEEYERRGLRHGARPAGTGKASELASSGPAVK